MANIPFVLIILFQTVVILLCTVLIYYLLTFFRIYHSKIHLESAFDSIEDPLAVVDCDYDIIRINKPYTNMINQTYQNIIGKKCYSILRGRSSVCVDCKLADVLAAGIKKDISLSSHPRESKRDVSINFYPFADKIGKKSYVIEHIRDITELEFLKNSLQQQNSILSNTTDTLQKAQSDIKNELKLARNVQQSVMPEKAPVFHPLKIRHLYHPIEAVGGDIYDFIQFSENKLGIFIGDVSGHGLPSAFVSTISKMSLYQHSKKRMQTNILMENINRDLIGNIRTSHYLTAFWGIFDNRYNSFTYSRAGHPMPIVFRANGDVVQMSCHGTFLGVMEDVFFEQKKFFFAKGDRCVLFTDGIYEVQEIVNGRTVVSGYNKFVEILKATKNLEIDQILPFIQKKFSSYTHEDDYTLIAFEVVDDPENDISEELPGFSKEDDISFQKFYSMSKIEFFLSFVLKQMKEMGYLDGSVKQTKQTVLHLISQLSHNFDENIYEKGVTFSHSFLSSTLKICISAKNNVFKINNDLPDNILLNTNNDAVSFSINKM